VTPRRRWPDGPDEASTELRRALDEASLRGPDDMTLRRGWSAVSLSLGGGRASPYDAANLGEPPDLDVAALMSPPRARRGFWFAWGVATTAALATVGAFWLWPHTGEVAQTSAQHHRPAAKSDVLPPGARRLTLEGGIEAVLAQSSVMRIEDGAPRVEGGEVRFSVPHRQPGHPFVVRAEDYRVVVVGTRFGVNVNGKGDADGIGKLDGKLDGKAENKAENRKVDVDVDEGIVEVWEAASGQRLARLTPGERDEPAFSDFTSHSGRRAGRLLYAPHSSADRRAAVRLTGLGLVRRVLPLRRACLRRRTRGAAVAANRGR